MDLRSRDRLLQSPAFQHLVARRWRVSVVLTLLLFILYYGYILLIALNKPLFSGFVGATPIGIPMGAAVILGSWILTAIYIVWANAAYDGEAARLRDSLK